MRTRRPSAEHQAAVARRLALLTAELAEARGEVPSNQPLGQLDELFPAGDLDLLEEETGEAPWVPVPGRHASRSPRRLPPVMDLLPTTLRGRASLAPAQVAVVALLVAAGLAITCWWLVRGNATEVTAPLPGVDASVGGTGAAPLVPVADPTPGSSAPASGASGAATPGATVTVDVAGKVRRPGIAVLPAGSRVVDALQAAGGARPGVDTSGLNLARLLVDGEQVLVGLPAPTGVVASAASGGAGAAAAPLVNLNTATEAELETLPEVGPVTAQAIVAWRSEHGAFTSVDELLEVDGIGDATLQKIAPFATL